jgi:hypothetical protein
MEVNQVNQLNQSLKINPILVKIVRKFFSQWTTPICVIYGNPETGKTDTSLLLAEIGLKENMIDYFASNINTFGRGERITNLEDLKKWFQLQTGRKLFILDEAGVSLFSRDALSKLNKEMIKECMLLRKFHVHMVFVLPDIAHLDEFKDSGLTGLYIKKKRGKNHSFNAIIRLRGFPYEIRVKNIPKTSIPYNTFDISPFTLEKEINEGDVEIRGLPYKVAYLYAKHGNFSIIARELEKIDGKKWKMQQVKRLLQKYLRDSLGIIVKRGRPKEKS